MTRYAFLSRLGSVAYVAMTYDENGGNLPNEIDGNKVEWNRIEASHGEGFLARLYGRYGARLTRDRYPHYRNQDETGRPVQYLYSCSLAPAFRPSFRPGRTPFR